MTSIDQALKTKIDTACRTAEDFAKLYYEGVDKRRHLMSKHYLDNGTLVWNGNGSTGKDNIQKYFLDLPASEHTVVTLDAQPIVDDAVASQLTCLIQVAGTVKFQDNPPKPFQQTFMITAQGDKWKIASDCFRLQDMMCVETK